MDRVKDILQKTFHKNGWEIEKPIEGWEQTSFITTLGNEKYFVKFGTKKEVMERLNKLEVIPKIISLGEDYAIQEFIPEAFINRQWLVDNLSTLAIFLKKYHKDKLLFQSITGLASPDKLTIEGELDAMLIKLNASPKRYEEVINGVKQLKEKYKNISIDFEPVHDDPNYKNIFLHNNKLVMIDWNNIRLSDQLSDIGAILWWYIPEERWKDFFVAYEMEFTEEVLERIYLAAAKMSMGFTIWCIENNTDYLLSFNDFKQAISQKENPRAWYKQHNLVV